MTAGAQKAYFTRIGVPCYTAGVEKITDYINGVIDLLSAPDGRMLVLILLIVFLVAGVPLAFLLLKLSDLIFESKTARKAFGRFSAATRFGNLVDAVFKFFFRRFDKLFRHKEEQRALKFTLWTMLLLGLLVSYGLSRIIAWISGFFA